MELTIKINSICSGGNHITMTVTKNGTVSKKFRMLKGDFAFEPDDYETVLATLIRSFVKKSGLTNMADIKTAIEAEVFKL